MLCGLNRVDTLITDERISDKTASMLDAADVTLIVAPLGNAQEEGEAAS